MGFVKYKIGDISTVSAGGDRPSICSDKKTKENTVPIFSNGMENEGLYGYTNQARIEGDTVTVSARGVNVGTVCYRPEPFMPIVRLLSLVPNREIVDAMYLYYNLKKTHISGTGSAQPQVTVPMISNLEIVIHKDLTEQKKISDLLSTFDRKILANNQINRNLYEVISAMYKHDYLDEIPNHPEWCEMTMDDITSKFATGLNPRKNFVLGHGDNFYVTIKNMNNNRIYLDSKCDMVNDDALEKINKRSDLQVGDLLFSGIGTIGRVHLIDKPADNWNVSESVFTMRPTPNVSSEFMYLLLLSYDMQDYAMSLASGSVQKGIRMADLKRYKLTLPSKEDMEKLTSVWKPIIAQIKKNEEESDRLAVLRDTLLPKLMSGELDVSELDI